jgi:hypothetical protein
MSDESQIENAFGMTLHVVTSIIQWHANGAKSLAGTCEIGVLPAIGGPRYRRAVYGSSFAEGHVRPGIYTGLDDDKRVFFKRSFTSVLDITASAKVMGRWLKPSSAKDP